MAGRGWPISGPLDSRAELKTPRGEGLFLESAVILESAVTRPLALVDLPSAFGALTGQEAGFLGLLLLAVAEFDLHGRRR